MSHVCAVILNSDSERFADVLFYPALQWTADILKKAGVSDIFAVSEDGGDPSCHPAKTIARHDILRTVAAFSDVLPVRFQGEGACVLLLSSPLPALERGTIVSLIKGHVYFGPGATLLQSPGSPGRCAMFDAGTFCRILPGSPLSVDAMCSASRENGGRVIELSPPAAEELLPPSDAKSVLTLQEMLRASLNNALVEKGVMMMDPSSAYISPEAEIESGAVILPGVIIKGKSTVGRGAVIGPNTLLDNAIIGARSSVNSSQVYHSTVGAKTNIGPFSHLRPGSSLGERARVGNFVEIKNTSVGDGSKVSHLTYLGDASVGKKVNIGCGAITVNYDGQEKYVTEIGDNSFIGCNTNLIAPVKIGKNAYTAAGSTITHDVPDGALAIARSRDVIKEGWMEKRLGDKPEK